MRKNKLKCKNCNKNMAIILYLCNTHRVKMGSFCMYCGSKLEADKKQEHNKISMPSWTKRTYKI